MGKFFQLFMQLLPVFIMGMQKIGGDLSGKDKKQAVSDGLQAVAAGVGAVAPQHAEAANLAAQTAVAAIDGVHAVLKETGALDALQAAPAAH